MSAGAGRGERGLFVPALTGVTLSGTVAAGSAGQGAGRFRSALQGAPH